MLLPKNAISGIEKSWITVFVHKQDVAMKFIA